MVAMEPANLVERGGHIMEVLEAMVRALAVANLAAWSEKVLGRRDFRRRCRRERGFRRDAFGRRGSPGVPGREVFRIEFFIFWLKKF